MNGVKLKYFNNLDGLRGIAAFSVLTFHFIHDTRATNLIDNIEFLRATTKILQHGVTLFFVLSGFVITRILLNTKGNKDYFSRFYKRRILRIFPLYYLYLIVHFYIFPSLIGSGPNLDFQKEVPIYLYLQNMEWLTGWEVIGPGHFWSLAVEEHFYLFWPLIVFLVPNKRIRLLTILLIIIAIPIRLYFIQNGIDFNHNTFSRYDSIMIGCLIAILERESNYSLPKLNLKFLVPTLSVLLIFGGFLYIFQSHFFLFKSSIKHIVLGLFFGLIIYSLITSNKRNIASRMLETKLMQYFGKISYGLYVWHMMAIDIVFLFGMENFVINLVLSIVITIAIAHLSYYYYERYFLKLKKQHKTATVSPAKSHNL